MKHILLISFFALLAAPMAQAFDINKLPTCAGKSEAHLPRNLQGEYLLENDDDPRFFTVDENGIAKSSIDFLNYRDSNGREVYVSERTAAKVGLL